jgi:hypothetical protein
MPSGLSIVNGDRAFDSDLPPPGGLPLGVVLGVTISLLVGLLLGGLTALQLHREERDELLVRQQLLAESLAPVAADLERASSLDEIERSLSSSVQAERTGGHSDFNLVLRDGDGRIAGSALSGFVTSPPRDALQTHVAVRSAVLPTGRGTLTAWQDGSGFAAEMASRRRSAWLDIAVAGLAIIILVQLAIYLLVTRPLGHLLASMHKVEMGYPARLRQGDIARELRWLWWRFYRLSESLTNGARLLVAAHRRAMKASRSLSDSGVDPELLDPLKLDRPGHSAERDMLRRHLLSRCALLEAYRPEDPGARTMAAEVWDHDAIEAEKLGELELAVRAENDAFKILHPGAFKRIQHQLASLVEARREWCDRIEGAIREALETDGVELLLMQSRTKHIAGVWRKMQEKGLLLDEVHDLLAFRLVVPGPDDCYLALDIIHRLFEPEPFRFKDYIANPKVNGYQSLHTSVSGRDGFVFEVQIRTAKMHRAAEEGPAAHWRYRSQQKPSPPSPRKSRYKAPEEEVDHGRTQRPRFLGAGRMGEGG